MKEKIANIIEKYPLLFYIVFLLIFGGSYIFYHNVIQPDYGYTWDVSFMKLALAFGSIIFMKEISEGSFQFGLHKKFFWKGVLLLFPCYIFGFYNLGTVSGSMTSEVPIIGYSLMMCIFDGAVTGFYEEIGIRGVLVGHMMKTFKNSKNDLLKVTLLSSALFGILHLNNIVRTGIGSIVQCVYAMAIGMLFAAVYIRTRNLWSCIVLHALVDFISDIDECFVYPGEPFLTHTTVIKNLLLKNFWLLIIVMVVIAVVTSLYLIRKSKREEIMELWND